MNATALVARLREAVHGPVEHDWPLARLTTYRLGGPAAVYVEPSGTDDLSRFAEVLRDADVDTTTVPVLALGRGSNIVVSDEGWPGIVLRLGDAFAWTRFAPGDDLVLTGASTSLPQLANWAARRELTGLEFLIAIPGSVGGAVRMNAGAHGREIKDCLASVRVFDLNALSLYEREAAALGLAYRRSNLAPHEIVVDAAFRLQRDDERAIRARMDAYRKHRAATQPGAVQNAGSVFKNPAGDSAGRLVEAAGLKGYRVGGAEVSKLHANFFVAGPGATAQDVFDLVHDVRAGVRAAFGVELEPEVRVVEPPA